MSARTPTFERVWHLSLKLEHETGADSLATIERVYDDEGGTYGCPYPKCKVRRYDSLAMWRHIHFGTVHPKSFGCSYIEFLARPSPVSGGQDQ